MINSINNNYIFNYTYTNNYAKKSYNIHDKIVNTNINTTFLSLYNNKKNTYYQQLDNIINNLDNTINNINIPESFNDIKQLINSYNHTLKFFNTNSNISVQNAHIYNSLQEITNPPISYESIGIKIDNSGQLQIDNDQLVNAINSAPNKVNNILIGLMSRTNNQLYIINSQYDNLFPPMNKMIGNTMRTIPFYTSGAYLQVDSYINIGNIINFYF